MMLCHVMMCLSGLLGSQITRNNRTDICILYYDAGCTDMERQAVKSSSWGYASEGSRSANRQQTS